MSRRPPRIRGFDYVGVYRHFLTSATHQRQRAFADPTFAREARNQLLQSAARQRFAVSAFCFMPDHVHLLLTGTDDNCALLPVINRWRQITGFIWRRQHESHLWQQGYWDRTLRDEDETLSVAAYIANNPIRSGLVDRLQDYPWVGSSEYTLEQLAEAVQIRPSGRG